MLQRDESFRRFDPRVFAQRVSNLSRPNFDERWYLLPMEDEPDGKRGVYAIESDALRRSYLKANGGSLEVQRLYEIGENTPTPQYASYTRGSNALRWKIRKR